MTARNVYATLPEYKAFVTASGQTLSADVVDDASIDGLLEAVSRFADGSSGRFFYPLIDTRYYSIPVVNNQVLFDADVLEVITFLNGNGASIASSAYNLLPVNETPKYGLKLKGSSGVSFESDSDGESDYVLSLTGIHGFHDNYSIAWRSAGTLGAAITDTTTLAFTMTAGHSLAVGQTVRIGNELYIVGTVSTNTITPLARGDNGSTAATHLNGTTAYTWQVMSDLKNATLEMTQQSYLRRFGQSKDNVQTITPGGVVLTPRDIPSSMYQFIDSIKRLV